MFSVSKKVASNKKQFEAFVRSGVNKSLTEMGIVGVSNIKALTPVDSGQLNGSNGYAVEAPYLTFFNNAGHAPYVELGTRFHPAQSFMRRGINNSLSPFARIIIKNMGV